MPDQSTPAPLTDQQLAAYEAIAARAAADPFYVSDCEGSLQVWRESALVHVRRDANGEIDMYSFPSSYRPSDQVIEIDLDSWDPGEDADDDRRRQDITDLVDARAAVGVMAAAIRRLRAQPTRRLEDGSTHTVQYLTDAGESCVQHACTAAREEDRLRQEQYTLRAAVEGVLDEVRDMADDEQLGAEQAARLRQVLRDALGLDRHAAAAAGEAGR